VAVFDQQIFPGRFPGACNEPDSQESIGLNCSKYTGVHKSFTSDFSACSMIRQDGNSKTTVSNA